MVLSTSSTNPIIVPLVLTLDDFSPNKELLVSLGRYPLSQETGILVLMFRAYPACQGFTKLMCLSK